MMKSVLAVVFLAIVRPSASAEGGHLTLSLSLWYRQPAPVEAGPPTAWKSPSAWFEALPVGNGRLGAMVFGGVERGFS